jgi:hypothetical protein
MLYEAEQSRFYEERARTMRELREGMYREELEAIDEAAEAGRTEPFTRSRGRRSRKVPKPSS